MGVPEGAVSRRPAPPHRRPAPAVTRREALASAERSLRLSVLDAKRGSAPASQGQA